MSLSSGDEQGIITLVLYSNANAADGAHHAVTTTCNRHPFDSLFQDNLGKPAPEQLNH